MKRFIISALLLVCLMVTLCVPAFAETVTYTTIRPSGRLGEERTYGSDEFCVKFNGQTVTFPDAQPFVDANNRTLVPVRFVSEKMGARVEWDGTTNTVSVFNDERGIRVDIVIGSKTLAVTYNGETNTVTMDTEAVVKEERTFVPVRYVAEALGAWVGYSDLFNTAQIYDDVLYAYEIDRLHGHDALDKTWTERCVGHDAYLLDMTSQTQFDAKYPWTKRFVGSGEYGFANANEWVMRCVQPKEYYESFGFECYKSDRTGLKYNPSVDADYIFGEMIAEEARWTVAAMFADDTSVDGSLRTDTSCVYLSRGGMGGSFEVRGILILDAKSNVSASHMKSAYGIELASGLTAGNRYLMDFQIPVQIDWNGNVYCTKQDGFQYVIAA